jgi:hypothetical protein
MLSPREFISDVMSVLALLKARRTLLGKANMPRAWRCRVEKASSISGWLYGIEPFSSGDIRAGYRIPAEFVVSVLNEIRIDAKIRQLAGLHRTQPASRNDLASQELINTINALSMD